MPWTKEYKAEYQRKYRATHPEYRKKTIEYHKNFKQRNPQYYFEYNKKWREENKTKHNLNSHLYKCRHPKKVKATLAARYVSIGDSCINCGSIKHLEKHHPNYSKPLEIITLCKKCHVKHHLELK